MWRFAGNKFKIHKNKNNMAVDPQVVEITKNFTNQIVSGLIPVILIAAAILIPLGLLLQSMENKVAKAGREFRARRNREKERNRYYVDKKLK